MLAALLLLAAAPGQNSFCGAARAAAPDVGAARRIAEAAVRNARAPTRLYRLVIIADRADARLWIAFQVPRTGPTRGGGGLEFRIDRCTGAISRMRHSR
ncbi:MAG: hypothetical protein QOD42_2900 [Sphingomonadales bacterium]|nr:hypothetical protein [Sphingomonadales bacterium]